MLFFSINLTINVAHPVFLMHIQSLLSGYAPAFNVVLSNMSSNLVTVKTEFYNNWQTIDLILMLRFGQGWTNVRCCEEKEVVLEETRL